MELKNVKLVGKLDVETGTTKAGKPWKKQVVIVEETDSQYPKTVALTIWNELVEKMEAKQIGEIVNCAIRIESREYNSRWYTDVSAYAIHGLSPSQPEPVAAPVANGSPVAKNAAAPPNDLPF